MSVDDASKDELNTDAKTEVMDEVEAVEAAEMETEVEEVLDEAPTIPGQEPEPKPEPESKPAPEPEPKPAPRHRPAPQPKERREAAKPVSKPAAQSLPGLGTGAWIGIAVAALVLGVVIGKFLLGGVGGGATAGSLGGKLTVTEAELDTTVATYTYNGTSATISAREVIQQNSSLDTAQDAEGNYTLPSADAVLSVARNSIIKKEAENRGLAVTDEELAAYSEETLGSSDYTSIATSYNMDEESVKELLTNSCLMKKLRDEVVEGDTGATMPEAPTAPETTTETKVNEETGEEEQVEVDNSDTPTAEYATYIIGLAGDEWDSDKGTWASTDGPYASALASYTVTKDSATYEAAQAAYYVAYQQYSEQQSAVSTQWTDFVNGLLSNASIQISTLVA